MSKTPQLDAWRGEFGRDYTDRNSADIVGLNEAWQKMFGADASDFFARNLEGIDRSARVLEVGCNTGNKLLLLESLGFENLYGVEPATYALQSGRERNPQLNVIHGDALDLPFKDGYFDLVYTSGVLIHIHPDDLDQAMREILRVSRRWVWGFEYFSRDPEEVSYRGHDGLLFKRNFASAYREIEPGLQLVRTENIAYLTQENEDQAYLLERPATEA